MVETVTIARLGAAGDGIAEGEGGPLFVPFALAGETVRVERDGRRAVVLDRAAADSPERVAPFCPYFGACGGCVAQHMAPPLYSRWKRDQLVGALTAARIAVAPDDLVDAHGAGRRRVTFHARFGSGVRVGFMQARSHELVEIDSCPVTEPRLAGAAAAARGLAACLSGRAKPLDLQVTGSEAGLDIDIRGHGPPDPRERQALIAAAARLDLARVSVHGEVLIERRPPRIGMGRAWVVPPPGSFLQATEAGETILAALVTEATGSARRVADLYAGVGTLSLRLAERSAVHAVEQDASALAALDKAARGAPGLRRIVGECRDLQRRPLLPPELAAFDAVILDPPRAGAEPQCRQLAASAVPLVVMVSCDAGTFARDAAILTGAGYTLDRVVPVDQFKYSAHLEMVGTFRKPRPAPSRRR